MYNIDIIAMSCIFSSFSFITDVDECASNPCENDAECINGADIFECICPEDYKGYTCAGKENMLVMFIDSVV